ncbi:unnamed protein product [marine sediment metagenome]|uniref:Uncharacterized protein n=1 Tax=marine sediment metagenome TaxID=412755 RepID=X0VZV8_9ZZZZ
MIALIKYTYMMEPEKVQEELDKLWGRYQEILNKLKPNWEEINEARAILFLTGGTYCEQIAVDAIKKRLHLLKEKLELIEFFNLIDKNSEKLEELRKDELFKKLEKFYRIIKRYKNTYCGGGLYFNEEKFIETYQKTNPNKELKIGYKGDF